MQMSDELFVVSSSQGSEPAEEIVAKKRKIGPNLNIESEEEILVLSESCSKSEEIQEETNLREENEKKDAKYIVIFKHKEFSKVFYYSGKEMASEMYDSIFKNHNKGKLYCEGSKISRHLTIAESGFFPGTNYVVLSGDDEASLKDALNLRLKRNDASPDSEILFDSSKQIRDLLEYIRKDNQMDDEMRVVYNGKILNEQAIIKDVLVEGSAFDLVSHKQLKIRS